jgi:hypothetical protein
MSMRSADLALGAAIVVAIIIGYLILPPIMLHPHLGGFPYVRGEVPPYKCWFSVDIVGGVRGTLFDLELWISSVYYDSLVYGVGAVDYNGERLTIQGYWNQCYAGSAVIRLNASFMAFYSTLAMPFRETIEIMIG